MSKQRLRIQNLKIVGHARSKISPALISGAIKLETLDELAKNSNREISQAAINIILDRASKTNAGRLLLREISVQNSEQRSKALATLKLLFKSRNDCLDHYKYTAFQSAITCLCHLLPQSLQYEIARSKNRATYPVQSLQTAIELMESLLYRFGVQTALECNIFDLWLSKYPFGGDFASQYPNDEVSQLKAKQRFVRNLFLCRDDDHTMAGIIGYYLAPDEKCHEKMVEFKLLDELVTEESIGERTNEGAYSFNEQSIYQVLETANPGLGPLTRGGRSREDSPEEQMLRRRRREAMVLGEMGRPIARGDIIQRVNT